MNKDWGGTSCLLLLIWCSQNTMWLCIVSTFFPIHCCLKWVSTLTSSKSFSSLALFFVFYLNWYKCTILSCSPRSLLRHLILSILCHQPPYRITPSLVLLEYVFPLAAPLASEAIKIKPFTNLDAPYQVKHFLSFEILAQEAFRNLGQLVSSFIHASCSFTREHFPWVRCLYWSPPICLH